MLFNDWEQMKHKDRQNVTGKGHPVHSKFNKQTISISVAFLSGQPKVFALRQGGQCRQQ